MQSNVPHMFMFQSQELVTMCYMANDSAEMVKLRSLRCRDSLRPNPL